MNLHKLLGTNDGTVNGMSIDKQEIPTSFSYKAGVLIVKFNTYNLLFDLNDNPDEYTNQRLLDSPICSIQEVRNSLYASGIKETK